MDKALSLIDDMLATPAAAAATGGPETMPSAAISDANANSVTKPAPRSSGDAGGRPLRLWDRRLPLPRPDSILDNLVI